MTLELDTLIEACAEILSQSLDDLRTRIYEPNTQKTMRSFSVGEAAELLGMDLKYLRRLHLDGKIPEVETTAGNHRRYTAEDVWNIRHLLEKSTRTPGKYVPGRREGDALQVLSVLNFKGGSGKTTTSCHLAQRLALKGYRVLAVDLDPQASLSAMHGIVPELDEGGTLYNAVRFEDPVPTRDVIRRTHIHGLDLIPGNLELTEFEYEAPSELSKGEGRSFLSVVQDALDQVEADYDVVVIDCPPNLGYLTMSSLMSSTGILITIHPQMLDLLSMAQFMRLAGELMKVLRKAGGNFRAQWMRFLLTRYKVGDAPQTDMSTFIRSMFEEYVLTNQMVESTAISDAGLQKRSLYEADRKDFTRRTFDRGIDAMNLVNDEIAGLIQKAWGR